MHNKIGPLFPIVPFMIVPFMIVPFMIAPFRKFHILIFRSLF